MNNRKYIFLLLVCLILMTGCAGFLTLVKDRLPSPHPVEGGIKFQIDWEAASSVQVIGSFNEWGKNESGRIRDPEIGKMTRNPKTDVWEAVIKLPPGRHIYKIVIDQGTTWLKDPNNKNEDENGENSLIIVE